MFSSPHLQKREIKIEQGKKQQNRNKQRKEKTKMYATIYYECKILPKDAIQ